MNRHLLGEQPGETVDFRCVATRLQTATKCLLSASIVEREGMGCGSREKKRAPVLPPMLPHLARCAEAWIANT